MTPRDTIGRFGTHGFTVTLWIEDGRIVAQWRERGERRQRSWPDTAPRRREAKEWARTFAQARAERRDAPELLTVAQLWTRFTEAEFAHLRPRTRKFYEECWRYWEVLTGAERIAEDLGMHTMLTFRADLEAKGLAINTMQRIVQTVKTVYKWGYNHRLLSRNDVQGFRFKVAKERRPVSPGEYRDWELAALLEELPLTKATTWRAGAAIALCGFQGARENAVLHLRWDDIDLEGDRICWRAAWDKLGREEWQPMRAPTRAVLEAIRHWTKGIGWIFPPAARHNTRPVYSKQSLWVALCEAEKRAGVQHRPYRALHGLRRMLFNNVLSLGGGLGPAMAAIRDRDTKVASRYLQPRDDELRAAFASLDRKGDANSSLAEPESPNPLLFHTGAVGLEPTTSGFATDPDPGQPADSPRVAEAPEPRDTPAPSPQSGPETATETAVDGKAPKRRKRLA